MSGTNEKPSLKWTHTDRLVHLQEASGVDAGCAWADNKVEAADFVTAHNNAIDALEKREAEFIETLIKGIQAVRCLMNDSEGVAGLHLNGDVAPWDELQAGGRFGAWLQELNAAEDAIAARAAVRKATE